MRNETQFMERNILLNTIINITEAIRDTVAMPVNEIQYSRKYCDEIYEYRHVVLPNDIAREVPRTHLMSETEWRNLGVQQSPGWIHYMIHSPEPHILLFRRLRTNDGDPPAPPPPPPPPPSNGIVV